MRHNFRQADFAALAAHWNAFYPEDYRIDAELLELNTVKSPLFDWGISQFETDAAGQILGFVAFKRSAASLFKGPSVDQAHLSAIAYSDPRVAVDLVADAKRVLRNRGVNRVVFGGDSRHFWPGCPADFGAMCGFLMVEGFEDQGEVFDLERDLSDYQAWTQPPDKIEFRPIDSEDELVALRVFLEASFSGRWLHDTLDKIRVEGDPGCVMAAFDQSKVVGFSLMQHWTHQLPIGGGVWRNSLGDRWASVGPIGVTSELRGAGIGHSLLEASLLHLKSLGGKQCIIDWTTLDAFYGKHGFKVTRRYRPSSLKLGD